MQQQVVGQTDSSLITEWEGRSAEEEPGGSSTLSVDLEFTRAVRKRRRWMAVLKASDETDRSRATVTAACREGVAPCCLVGSRSSGDGPAHLMFSLLLPAASICMHGTA